MLVADLPDDVRAELESTEFGNRQHYSRSTYAMGCRGPLCRKAERDRGRRRQAYRAQNAGREYRPSPELRRATGRDELLQKIVEEHFKERSKVA